MFLMATASVLEIFISPDWKSGSKQTTKKELN